WRGGVRSGPLHLDYDRIALAAARADRRAAVAAAAPPQLVDERGEDARAGRADRMADRPGPPAGAPAGRAYRRPERHAPAVDVHAVLVDAEHADRVQGHRRERLVDLPEVDVTG